MKRDKRKSKRVRDRKGERKKKEKKQKCSLKTGKEEKDFGKLKKISGRPNERTKIGNLIFLVSRTCCATRYRERSPSV